MTDMKTNEKQSPHNIELLLPWHAAGTLNSRDADEVEKALAQDKELADAPGTTSHPSYRPKLKIATISTSSGSSEESGWNKSLPGKETQSCARGS
jgi:hypothetical protein